MEKTYSPDGNYAQNKKYRRECARLREAARLESEINARAPKRKRQRAANPNSLPRGKWDVRKLPYSNYWQQRATKSYPFASTRQRERAQ